MMRGTFDGKHLFIIKITMLIINSTFLLVQFSSVTHLRPTLCDPKILSTPGLPVHHQHPEFTQTHVHRVNDAIKPSSSVILFSSCPQSLPASESFPMSQLSHEVAKVLEFQL